ncbi:MAG: type II toxin-antitoxin system YafQ family toxin [Candidatus Symbiothrix sp.]|jgi:mRNA interferase YafQ|nr:type II toxin-antitoxin system YafQ family toxin [Candidatus Symbiothrix sp.]
MPEIIGVLPSKYKAHQLKGKYHNIMECHIQPDWLLVWEQNNEKLTLIMMKTGTHSDLF